MRAVVTRRYYLRLRTHRAGGQENAQAVLSGRGITLNAQFATILSKVTPTATFDQY